MYCSVRDVISNAEWGGWAKTTKNPKACYLKALSNGTDAFSLDVIYGETLHRM